LPITGGCHSAAHDAFDYLQTAWLDFLSAWNMIEDAKQQLRSVEFDDILKKTLNFITQRDCGK